MPTGSAENPAPLAVSPRLSVPNNGVVPVPLSGVGNKPAQFKPTKARIALPRIAPGPGLPVPGGGSHALRKAGMNALKKLEEREREG